MEVLVSTSAAIRLLVGHCLDPEGMAMLLRVRKFSA